MSKTHPKDGLKQYKENFFAKCRSGSVVITHLNDLSTIDFSKLLTVDPYITLIIFSNKLNVSNVLPVSESFSESLLNEEMPSISTLDLSSFI